jgi:hypothetical protein
MNFIRTNKILVIIITAVIVLIIIRLVSPGNFKPDAKKWAEPSINRTNIVSIPEAGSLEGEKLIVTFGQSSDEIKSMSGSFLASSPDSVLSKVNLKKIKSHDGPVLLYSQDISVSARVWMVFGQLGYRNVFIVTENPENEVLKYKFRPDTIRPEL